MRKTSRYLCEVGVIAALYAVLTIMLAPISYGPMQVRVSEALCILPYFTAAAVPGLFIGCLISNIAGIMLGSSLGLLDVIVGSLTTLAAAWISSRIRMRPLVPLPAVVLNAFTVPYVLWAVLGVPYWPSVFWVAAGQALACFGLGLPLLYVLERNRKAIFQ